MTDSRPTPDWEEMPEGERGSTEPGYDQPRSEPFDLRLDPDFDAEAAMRRFPSEAEWLRGFSSADFDWTSFVARTLAARRDEVEMEGRLADLERSLPPALWRAFAAPEPSPTFVERTLKVVHDERRHRWQKMLARHVAPEPSPRFVARTLAALAADRESSAQLLGRKPQYWRPNVAWPLLALAASLLVWFAIPPGVFDPGSRPRPPQASALFAHAYAPSPMPALLSGLLHRPDVEAAMADAPDGVWLLLARN